MLYAYRMHLIECVLWIRNHIVYMLYGLIICIHIHTFVYRHMYLNILGAQQSPSTSEDSEGACSVEGACTGGWGMEGVVPSEAWTGLFESSSLKDGHVSDKMGSQAV